MFLFTALTLRKRHVLKQLKINSVRCRKALKTLNCFFLELYCPLWLVPNANDHEKLFHSNETKADLG